MTNKNIKSVISSLLELLSYATPRRRKQLGLLFCLMLLCSIAEVVSIGAIIPFLTAIIGSEPLTSIPILSHIYILRSQNANHIIFLIAIFLCLSAIFAAALRILLSWGQTRLSYSMGAELSVQMYERTLHLPYESHLTINSSETISAITNKANGLIGNALFPALTILSSAVIMIMIMTMIIFISPQATIGALCVFGFLYFIISVFTKSYLSKQGEIINLEYTNVVKALQEGLGSIRDVIIDHTQFLYVDIYKKAEFPLRRALANVAIVSSTPRFVVEAVAMVLIACLAYLSTNENAALGKGIPILGAFALATQRMLPLLQQSYASWASIKGGQAMVSSALEVLRLPKGLNLDVASKNTRIIFHKNLQLNNVSFRYVGSSSNVLSNINITIQKGGFIGIVGATGCGKSTLMDIIMGLLSPTDGYILVDGERLDSSNKRGWQDKIAHVPQSIFLMDATIAENIALSVEKNTIDMKRVVEAAEKAQLLEAINCMSSKFRTVVGERGVRLSGGQRQRIGIARALYKEAEVLIFDEATSALDEFTEDSVMRALESIRHGLTVIIVSHRKNTLKNCDQVIELQNKQAIVL
jgi:ABC-type multidrug transport system fused ATPase/permease subunit